MRWRGAALLALAGRGDVGAAKYCLEDVPDSELSPLVYQGSEYVLPLGAGYWDSPGPVAELLKILLMEKLKVPTVIHWGRASTELLKWVVGCTDEGGELWDDTDAKGKCDRPEDFQDPPVKAWVAVEVWETTVENLRLQAFLGATSSLGYQSFPGLYTQSTVIDRAAEQGVLLKWYEAYIWRESTDGYFSQVQTLERAMREIVPTHFPEELCVTAEDAADGNCGAGGIRPLCDGSIPSSATYVQSMENVGLTCSGGWWYSPYCIDDKATCIPVILGSAEWNMKEWCQAILALHLPFAVTWVGWHAEQEVVLQLSATHAFLFYWWEPDTSFLGLAPRPPEQVMMDDKLLNISQFQSLVAAVWDGLREVRPDVDTFIRKVSLTDKAVEGMMVKKLQGETDFDVACDWLKNPANQHQWEAWLPAEQVVYVPEITTDGAIGVLLASLAGSMIGSSLLCAVVWCCHRRRKAARDAPDVPGLPVGNWVLKWAGPHAQGQLGARTAKGEVGFMGRKSWLVNTSPFHVVVKADGVTFHMRPWSFCRKNLHQSFGHSTLDIEVSSRNMSEDDWQRLPDEILFRVKDGDWTRKASGPDADQPNSVTYVNPTVRRLLPAHADGRSMGHFKLALGPNRSMLMLWSPPHTVRAIPVKEFERFMDTVINHPKTWEQCSVVNPDGTVNQISKGPGSTSRSMYDACTHVVHPEAACVDASYAEARTKYGPANIFISHVWAEHALNTRSAVNKLHAWLQAANRGRTSMDCGDSDDSGMAFNKIRVWFCTLCNNQSRVVEELGKDVYKSPFAQVLRSPTCSQVALVSPFRALHRKWCNYEFALSRYEQKTIFMVTAEGVVQAGHVPPKTLNELAKKVVSFNCKDATCSSREDEQFIDAAVLDMGGYQALDGILKDVFRVAIFEAHQCLDQAVHCIGGRKPAPSDGCEAADELQEIATEMSAKNISL